MQFLAVFTIAIFFLYLTVILVEKNDENVLNYSTYSYTGLIVFNIICLMICEIDMIDYIFILEVTFHIPRIIRPFYYNEKEKIVPILGAIFFLSRYFWLLRS